MAKDDTQHYLEGRRRAWVRMLQLCLEELGVFDDVEAAKVRWVVERQEMIAVLRRVCQKYGDKDDWPDDAYLPDVIAKHLEKHLDREIRG